MSVYCLLKLFKKALSCISMTDSYTLLRNSKIF